MSAPKVVSPAYVETEYTLGLGQSIIQSFFLTLAAEIGDRTFILLIILTHRTSAITVLLASVLAELGMNIIAMILGFAIDILLYKNIIDYIGIIIFMIFGLWLLIKNLFSPDEKDSKSFDEDLKSLNDKNTFIPMTKINSDRKLETIFEDNNEDKEGDKELNDNLLNNNEQKDTENIKVGEDNQEDEGDDDTNLINNQIQKPRPTEFDSTYFWAIISSMAIAECGDRTQFTSMSMAALFDFKGVFIGSGSALILTCVLGVFLGEYVIKHLKERVINCLLGLIFVFYSTEIYYSKIQGVNLI